MQGVRVHVNLDRGELIIIIKWTLRGLGAAVKECFISLPQSKHTPSSSFPLRSPFGERALATAPLRTADPQDHSEHLK